MYKIKENGMIFSYTCDGKNELLFFLFNYNRGGGLFLKIEPAVSIEPAVEIELFPFYTEGLISTAGSINTAGSISTAS